MKSLILKSTTALAGLTAMTAVAAADISAKATTDLNIRSGPGPHHEVVGVIDADASATVEGCAEGSKWCMVSYNGVEGWAYSDYLAGNFANSGTVVLSERPDGQLPTVSYESTASTAAGMATGVATGAVAGALIGGPVGAAVGATAGGVAGGAVDTISSPPKTVRSYVQDHSMEPVYLEGEVVVGAGVPETVEVQPIPDYQYHYVNVNGQLVLVEPETRRIVYVMR